MGLPVANGQIISRTVECGLGTYITQHEWQGGPVIDIDPDYLPQTVNKGDVVELGGYRLRIVDYDVRGLAWKAVRDDWRGQLMVLHIRIAHRFERTCRRLILTAAVWGFADYHQGRYPTWRDMHILRKLAKRVKRG